MRIEFFHRPAHTLARVRLEEGESIVAEAGAMVGMSTNMHVETRAGGLVAGVKRMLGGESFFQNTFTAEHGLGEVLLSHGLPGDLVELSLDAGDLVLSAGAFVASSAGVQIDTLGGSMKTALMGEGMFLLRARAREGGRLLVGAFGGVEALGCEGELVVDTGHLVAWDAALATKVRKSGSGWIASWLSGEGLVTELTGSGRVWIQSRNPSEYGRSVGRRLPARAR